MRRFRRITRSFKRDPHGKVTQTAFWSAYRVAFTDRAAQLSGPQLMNASEVIKIVSEIVPGASASVEPNPENPSAKVFLIKGIRERKRASAYGPRVSSLSRPDRHPSLSSLPY